jgi:hypothetical protein
MRVKQIGLALIGALAVVGCSKDEGPFLAPQVPLAFTRFINAIPDTGSVDFRFIDILEYSPYAIQLQFRGFTPYQGTAPGSRHLRVFTDPGGSPSLEDVTQILADELITLEANKYYTIAIVGFSRAGSTPSLALQVYEDPIPDPGANVAYRVVNLATGLGAVDVSLTAADADPIPTPTFASVAYLAASQYVTTPTGTTWFRVQDAGAAEIVTGSGRRAPAGSAGDPLNHLTTIGGSDQPGSVVTAWIFPSSVEDSEAPQNLDAPSILFTVDRHPR